MTVVRVPFALAMASVSGSAPFVALVFDDGAAVSLHSVRALAGELGLKLPRGTVFDLVEDWDRSFPVLADLVQVLAHGDEARGHRGHFVAEDLLTMERLLPEARQVIRVGDGAPRVLPAAVQVGAGASVLLDDAMQAAVPNLCFAAVVGRMCRDLDKTAAAGAIAGWTLATELLRLDRTGLGRCSSPGALVLGPLFVPAPFANELLSGEALLATTGAPAMRRVLSDFATPMPGHIAALSRDCLLTPGDVIVAGGLPPGDIPPAGKIDTLEAVAAGFGRQTVSLY